MHEIPNLPFPSLHPTEQPTPQQASDKQPKAKEAKPVDGKRLGCRRTRPCVKRVFERLPHRLNYPGYLP
jgi:hypothetical protein